MTEPRQTPAPGSDTSEPGDDTTNRRGNDTGRDEIDTPPAAEPAAEDQEIDTAGTEADPTRTNTEDKER